MVISDWKPKPLEVEETIHLKNFSLLNPKDNKTMLRLIKPIKIKIDLKNFFKIQIQSSC